MRKTLVASAAVLATAGLLAVPTAANAASSTGCRYPYVCFYRGHDLTQPTGKFRDAGYWQHLTRSRGADGFVNTRRHDGAKIRLYGGRVICVGPHSMGGLMRSGATDVEILRGGCP
jgi:hypothetical protein